MMPETRYCPLTRGLGFLGLHWRPMIDYFSYLLLEKNLSFKKSIYSQCGMMANFENHSEFFITTHKLLL